MQMLISTIVVFMLASCTALPPIPPDDAATAQCPVCRYDRDLACLNVVKLSSTPRMEYKGRNYFFCSDSCRDKCMGTPTKFIQP